MTELLRVEKETTFWYSILLGCLATRMMNLQCLSSDISSVYTQVYIREKINTIISIESRPLKSYILFVSRALYSI